MNIKERQQKMREEWRTEQERAKIGFGEQKQGSETKNLKTEMKER